jgi:hypothetical protein
MRSGGSALIIVAGTSVNAVVVVARGCQPLPPPRDSLREHLPSHTGERLECAAAALPLFEEALHVGLGPLGPSSVA